jgi:hypothetical protein
VLAAGLIRANPQAHLALARVGEQPPSSTPTWLPVRTNRRRVPLCTALFCSASGSRVDTVVGSAGDHPIVWSALPAVADGRLPAHRFKLLLRTGRETRGLRCRHGRSSAGVSAGDGADACSSGRLGPAMFGSPRPSGFRAPTGRFGRHPGAGGRRLRAGTPTRVLTPDLVGRVAGGRSPGTRGHLRPWVQYPVISTRGSNRTPMCERSGGETMSWSSTTTQELTT